MNEYYTHQEREALLNFADEETQEQFREYRKEIEKYLPEKHSSHAGFNFCLKMIREATDIEWENVRWKGLYSSMVAWFSVLAIEVWRDKKKKLNEICEEAKERGLVEDVDALRELLKTKI